MMAKFWGVRKSSWTCLACMMLSVCLNPGMDEVLVAADEGDAMPEESDWDMAWLRSLSPSSWSSDRIMVRSVIDGALTCFCNVKLLNFNLLCLIT